VGRPRDGRLVIEALLQAERLLAHGMVDQAERIYAGAIEQDPRNAIAVVGLARVALERGDDRLAYDRARQALDIDPQNAAALRLEARLAEVLDAREGADRGPATPEASEPVPSADALPSEQHTFDHNPSMADHRQMEERREELPHPSPRDAQEPTATEAPAQRPGLLRRLLGE
jgi:tetratricopeptide (TPR) repeat protein